MTMWQTPPSMTPQRLADEATLAGTATAAAHLRGLADVKHRHPEISIYCGEFRTWRAVIPVGDSRQQAIVRYRPGDLLADLRRFFWEDP